MALLMNPKQSLPVVWEGTLSMRTRKSVRAILCVCVLMHEYVKNLFSYHTKKPESSGAELVCLATR